MVICLYGKIQQVNGKTLRIWDEGAESFVDVEWIGEDEPIAGSTGVFVGDFKNGKFNIKDINIRKFLNPLDETQLYRDAADNDQNVLNAMFYKMAAQLEDESRSK